MGYIPAKIESVNSWLFKFTGASGFTLARSSKHRFHYERHWILKDKVEINLTSDFETFDNEQTIMQLSYKLNKIRHIFRHAKANLDIALFNKALHDHTAQSRAIEEGRDI